MNNCRAWWWQHHALWMFWCWCYLCITQIGWTNWKKEEFFEQFQRETYQKWPQMKSQIPYKQHFVFKIIIFLTCCMLMLFEIVYLFIFWTVHLTNRGCFCLVFSCVKLLFWKRSPEVVLFLPLTLWLHVAQASEEKRWKGRTGGRGRGAMYGWEAEGGDRVRASFGNQSEL